MSEWKATACILCELNCGIKVKVGEQNTLEKIRGDKDHPGSKGYLCNKASRLDHYQNGRDRIYSPLKRMPDGTFEEITWDTAISELAEKLLKLKAQYGGDKLLYIGGGGQGNHITSLMSALTRQTLGSIYHTNAIAQEKTGEIWGYQQMMNEGMCRADFENTEVGVFLGKNPWQSHGFHQCRKVLQKMAKDPKRKIVVFDPRRTESADMADYHLAVKPGTDAWALAAIVAILVQEDWINHDWVAQHTENYEEIKKIFGQINVDDYCKQSGLDKALVYEVTEVMKNADSVAFWEDLGVQMNRNSTLVSYLNKLIWLLTGNFAKKGAQYIANPLARAASGKSNASKRTPVTNARIIGNLIPCNSVPDEVLTDHPDRMRAIWVDCSNPVHSYADSKRMAEAMREAELSVAVDIAMTETAIEADYVLPAATQFEKTEVSFFNFDFPHNVMHVRGKLFEAPDTVLTEAEIHARLCEAMGVVPQDIIDILNAELDKGREGFAQKFFELMMSDPELMKVASVILYRTLGRKIGDVAEIAPLYPLVHKFAMKYPDAVKAAGHEGDGLALGENLFDALVKNRSGVEFSREPYEASFKRVRRPDHKFNLFIPGLVGEIESLDEGVKPLTSAEYPFVLSAGERRDYTANGIYRDINWKKKDLEGALKMSPEDADSLGVETGSSVKIKTNRGEAMAVVEVSERMQSGHMSIPNGGGLTNGLRSNQPETIGVPANQLTDSNYKDFLAGTPWHKYVPAQIEPVKG